MSGASVVELDNKEEDKMASYLGSGDSLEAAVIKAHGQIPRSENEAVICRVLQWGYHVGGYVKSPKFYALVCREDIIPETQE